MMHFLTLKTKTAQDLENILSLGLEIKNHPHRFREALIGKKMYMLFQKTSTRTALSFGLGMNELGGIYFVQKWEDSNFCVSEMEDEIAYISRNVDIVMARLKRNEDISCMAEHSSVPVINGCCNKYHPCQAMADLLTIKEIFSTFEIKLLYIGVLNNVFNSLAASLPRLGGKLLAILPLVNESSIDDEIIRNAQATGRFTQLQIGGRKKDNLRDVVASVDVVYTDTWVDMEFFHDPGFEVEKKQRTEKMVPFQLNDNLLRNTKALVMHPMPMHPGFEITRDVINVHRETILQQGENRRHIQKAILLSLIGGVK